jgi:RNA polymerase sigma factor (sigma-70 family)
MAAESLAPLPDTAFLELLARVRGGDDTAAAELVQRYERVVLRSVRSRLGKSMRSAMDSMDVMQSVHRSLLTGVKSQRFHLASPQQLIGLAVVMVQRKVARYWRKLKQFPALSNGADGKSVVNALDAIASDASAPSEMAATNDLLERLLGQLGDVDRQLVRLKLDGHSSVEVGQILGREPAFIRMRWSRLRQMLRKRDHLDD